MKVAVILPSRGLLFSQTADEILQNLKGIPHKFFFAHGLPLPKCFEKPTCEAVFDDTITHLWFVEEDMVLPPDVLKQMLDADVNAISVDYPITKEGKGSIFCDSGGNVVFSGTGCLLVRKEVFDAIKAPYFTDKVRWTMLNYGEPIKLVAHKNTHGGYGLHDITFCIKLWKTGIKIRTLPMVLGQRRLIAWGKAGSNDGAHNIEVWDKVVPGMRLKELKSQPIALGAKSKLVTVRTPKGDISASATHAETLVGKGLAEYPPKSYVIIDDSEVQI